MIHQKTEPVKNVATFFIYMLFAMREKLSEHDVSKHRKYNIAYLFDLYGSQRREKETTLISMKGKRRHKLESF